MHRLRVQRALPVLEGMQTPLGAVDLAETVRLRQSATSSKSDVLRRNAHVHQGLGVVESSPERSVQLLPLKLVLNSLPVRSVADQRKHRSDAFNKHGTLSRVSVIQSGLVRVNGESNVEYHFTHLDTVVSVRIPQKLLESGTVEHLSDQDFSGAMLSNSDALSNR